MEPPMLVQIPSQDIPARPASHRNLHGDFIPTVTRLLVSRYSSCIVALLSLTRTHVRLKLPYSFEARPLRAREV